MSGIVWKGIANHAMPVLHPRHSGETRGDAPAARVTHRDAQWVLGLLEARLNINRTAGFAIAEFEGS